MVEHMVRGLVLHGRIQTTHARAKEVQRVADRLVTWGKEGSLHARRMAFRVLQDRTLVKQLFSEISPRFVDCPGGYTRVIRMTPRLGDGASRAMLAFSRLPVEPPPPTTAPKAKTPAAPKGPSEPPSAPRPEATKQKPKQLFEGLRSFWTRKRGRGS
jgi:large subunit ribosomal protein L17